MQQQRRELLRLAAGTAAVSGFGLARLDAANSPGEMRHGTAENSYDVRRFGAAGDGHTIDSPAVNRAIEAASSAGGGTVRFTPGTYACYSIRLRDNITLLIEQGATILAAPAPALGSPGYDPPEPDLPWAAYQDYGHTHWHNSLIWGEDLHDIAICGTGLIWGKGLDRGWGRNTSARHDPAGEGNKCIALKNCRNVQLRDFAILQGGWFGILATGVDNLTIDNLRIDTNRDGMDIDCCRNVRISNCTVNSPWDDAIVPKSSYALGYSRPTENVTISNCYVTGAYQMGTLLDGTFKRFAPGADVPHVGRIKLGTESNGGFKNISIANCVFEGCRGLALETVDGALLEDIAVSNITMRDIASAPIFLRLGARMRGPKGTAMGRLRRVLISNIVASNVDARQCSILSGIPGASIEDIHISDIFVEHRGGGTSEQAARQPPEAESGYPEPTMFGDTPAQGFYLRHVAGLDLSHVEIASRAPDQRPVFLLDTVQDADFLAVRARRPAGVPLFSLRDVKSFRCAFSGGVPDTAIAQVASRRL